MTDAVHPTAVVAVSVASRNPALALLRAVARHRLASVGLVIIAALIFILAMSAVLGPGLQNVMLSFALFGWTIFARLARGQVLLVRELPFIEAARSVGVPATRIMFRHILPNIMAPVLVAITITIGVAILVESGVSFLGLGVQPPTASWGKELRVGFTYLEAAPLFSIAPGVMITLAVIAFNFVGDGLRDALDPRLRGANRVPR